MKALIFLFFAVILFTGKAAHSEVRRFVVKSERGRGRFELRVYDQDIDIAKAQTRISQRLVGKKVVGSGDTEVRQALLQYNSRPLSVMPAEGRPLWIAKQNSWTPADEADYSRWFAANVDENFARGSGITADCADMALLFRWVYAHDHQLPIANTMAGSGNLFGHFSSNAEWDALPSNSDWKKDERFKAALQYLWDNTYTHSIEGDLAPTLVNTSYVRPGSVFMIVRAESGHTQTLQRVDPAGGIQTLWGDVPASDKIYSSPLMVETDTAEFFGVWRTPVLQTGDGSSQWVLVSAVDTSGYSDEQAGLKFSDEQSFDSWVYARLGIVISDANRLLMAANDFTHALAERASTATSALFACYYQPCGTDSQTYDDFSTFERDGRLIEMQQSLRQLVNKMGESDPAVVKLYASMSNQFLVFGLPLSYVDLLKNDNLKATLNPDPRVSFADRWGLTLQNPTRTDQFYIDAQVLFNLLKQRTDIVSYQEASLALDQNCAFIFQRLVLDRQNPNFDSAAFAKVYSEFANNGVNDEAAADLRYSFDAVTWGSGSSDQIPSWSSQAGASLDLRWGLGPSF